MMTREEAIALFEKQLTAAQVVLDSGFGSNPGENDFLYRRRKEMAEIALSALRHQEWEEQLWHDAKSDPPKTPGLYYGKKDATNSMYACQYRDGVWVLDMYPQQQMDIVQWADYTAFVREGE